MIEIIVVAIFVILVALGIFHFLSDGDTTTAILGIITSQFVKKAKSQSTRNEMGNEPRKFGIGIGGILIILFVIAVFVWMTMVTVVPAGYVGVKDTFGNVDKDVLLSGIHLKSPFTSVIPMSIQTQTYLDYDGKSDVATIVGLSNEGLSVTMGIAANYHLDPSKAVDVYKQVGKNYESVILNNPVHSVPRDLISKYEVKTLYSAGISGTPDRLKIETELATGIQDSINRVGVKDSIYIEQVYIRTIDPPEAIKNAIAAKLKSEQERDQERFEVQKMEITAEKMRAEGRGIADRNKLITESLTPEYIAWYTVEMMKAHPGATYFIPIDSSGRVNPNIVIPVAGDTKV